MKSWHEIFISGKNNINHPIDSDPALDLACSIRPFTTLIGPVIVLTKYRAGTFGTEEHRKRENKQAKRQKRERGDLYRPLSGYVFHPFYRRKIFVENALVAQNQWEWWFTMSLNVSIDYLVSPQTETSWYDDPQYNIWTF